MTDHDALLRAICAAPDDDTPRLVLADLLEEGGDADRAAFVRAQVRLARTPDWEPFAAYCRHRRPDWSAEGRPFRRTLPPLPDGWNVAWDDRPFRRGLGWRVNVRSLFAWREVAPALLDRAPVGELYLNPAATLDDWRAFAAGPGVPNLRVLRVDGARLSEPLRALREAPAPPPLTDIHFHRSTSPGIGFIVADLLRSPLDATLRGLHFHVGDAYHAEDLIDALTDDAARFDRLTLGGQELTADGVRRWCDRGGPRRVAELDLGGNTFGADGVRELARGLAAAGAGPVSLGLAGVRSGPDGLEALAWCPPLAGLRRLDLSRNPVTPRAARALALSGWLAGVRSLGLARCGVNDKCLRHLARAKFWPGLVELDLRENPVSAAGVRHLLDAEVPPDLTALVLSGYGLGTTARAELRHKFGDAAVFAEAAHDG